MEEFRKCFKFQVCNMTLVGLNSSDHIFIHVISGKLQFLSEITLREMISFSKFYEPVADKILFTGMCSGFGIQDRSLSVKKL